LQTISALDKYALERISFFTNGRRNRRNLF